VDGEVNGYSVKEGYNTLLSTLRVYQNSTKWKNVWSQDSLPKVNFFTWSLSHGKILTGENLMKRGFHDPFICPLCQSNQDNIHHLFWNCPFSQTVWKVAFRDLSRKIRWPSAPIPSLGNWEKYYQGSFREKPVLKRIWRAVPKFVCWQIWLARNNQIFQGIKSPPQSVTAKAKMLLSEVLNAKSLNIEDPTNWNALEKDWMASFNLHSSKTSNSAHRSCWQLHKIQNIEDWIQEQQSHTLCFDGASKGNPGEAGGGGGGSLRSRRKKNFKLSLESRDGY
jgi:hypothetical protein